MDKTDMHEQLSAMVDDELDGRDCAELLRQIKSDERMRCSWQCYHLISDSLRKNLAPHVPKDFCSQVSQALENEPVVFAPQRKSPRLSPFMKQVAGLGVAASVTAVAILGTQQYVLSTGGGSAQVAQVPAAPSADQFERIAVPEPAVAAAGQPVLPANGTAPNLPRNMGKYLVNHNQNAPGMPGVMPYARIVVYPAENPKR